MPPAGLGSYSSARTPLSAPRQPTRDVTRWTGLHARSPQPTNMEGQAIADDSLDIFLDSYLSQLGGGDVPVITGPPLHSLGGLQGVVPNSGVGQLQFGAPALHTQGLGQMANGGGATMDDGHNTEAFTVLGQRSADGLSIASMQAMLQTKHIQQADIAAAKANRQAMLQSLGVGQAGHTVGGVSGQLGACGCANVNTLVGGPSPSISAAPFNRPTSLQEPVRSGSGGAAGLLAAGTGWAPGALFGLQQRHAQQQETMQQTMPSGSQQSAASLGESCAFLQVVVGIGPPVPGGRSGWRANKRHIEAQCHANASAAHRHVLFSSASPAHMHAMWHG